MTPAAVIRPWPSAIPSILEGESVTLLCTSSLTPEVIYSPSEIKAIYSPSEIKAINSPSEIKAIYFPSEIKAIYSPSEIKAINSPSKISGGQGALNYSRNLNKQ